MNPSLLGYLEYTVQASSMQTLFLPAHYSKGILRWTKALPPESKNAHDRCGEFKSPSETRLAAEIEIKATLDQNRERHPLRVLGFYSASVVRRPAPVLDCSSHSSHETAWNFGWLLAHMTRLVEPRPCDVQRDLTASMSIPAHPNFHRRARRAQQSVMPLDSGIQTRGTRLGGPDPGDRNQVQYGTRRQTRCL